MTMPKKTLVKYELINGKADLLLDLEIIYLCLQFTVFKSNITFYVQSLY